VNEFKPPSDDALDCWLAKRHETLIRDLEVLLDVEAGLRDATFPGTHAELIDGLGDIVNVEAGLSAITNRRPASSNPEDRHESRTQRPEQEPSASGALQRVIQQIMDLRNEIAREVFKDSAVTKKMLIARRIKDHGRSDHLLRSAYRDLTYLAKGLADRTISKTVATDYVGDARRSLVLANDLGPRHPILLSRRFVAELDTIADAVARLFDSADDCTPVVP
jgi:hypothetical protein